MVNLKRNSSTITNNPFADLMRYPFCLAGLLLLSMTVVAQQRVRIISATSPQVQFAEEKIRSSLKYKGYDVISGNDEKAPGNQQETYIILGVSESYKSAAVQSSVM